MSLSLKQEGGELIQVLLASPVQKLPFGHLASAPITVPPHNSPKADALSFRFLQGTWICLNYFILSFV